jgi:uncharacterized RDD family membrane protein YckC
MRQATDERPAVLTYAGSLSRIAFTTVAYWSGVYLPEENHAVKGEAWARIGHYRWAIWHFQKCLTHGEDSVVRMTLAWCYSRLGRSESAVEHYRQAYDRTRQPDVALYVAHAELDVGNATAARRLHAEAVSRRRELGSDAESMLADLESRLATWPSPSPEQTDESPPLTVPDVPRSVPSASVRVSNIPGQRVVAFVVDLVGTLVVAYFVGYLLAVAESGMSRGGTFAIGAGILLKDILGASPGKFLVGLRVAGTDGKPTNAGRRIARNVTIAFAFFVLSIPAFDHPAIGLTAILIACVDSILLLLQGSRIGDRIAGTSVVHWR